MIDQYIAYASETANNNTDLFLSDPWIPEHADTLTDHGDGKVVVVLEVLFDLS